MQLRTGSDQGKEGDGRVRKHALELVQAQSVSVCVCARVCVCAGKSNAHLKQYTQDSSIEVVNILVYSEDEMLKKMKLTAVAFLFLSPYIY